MESLDTAREQNTDVRIDELVSSVQSGQTEAFSLLYEEYLGRVYRYVYARIGKMEQAEDITQEVFVRAFKSISTYRCRGRPFLAWLVRIAHNLVVDYYRRANRLHFVPLAEPVAASGEIPRASRRATWDC